MADESKPDLPKKPARRTRRTPARGKQAATRRAAKTSGPGKPVTTEEAVASAGAGGSDKLSAKDLLDAANSASATARNAWLGFVLLLAYLLVTLAGVTHKDLLLNSPVTLPIVGVEIPLFTFFIAAPVLLILVHLGLLVQHALLAHKLYYLSRAVSAQENPGERNDLLRVRLHNYTFSQLLAGPKPPTRLEWLMRLMVFLTLGGLPVLTLLYFQIKFLPYHDVPVTYWHRLIIVLDILLIFAVRRNIGMQLFRDPLKMIEPDETDWQWRLTRRGYWCGVAISGVIVLFSWFVATVPDGCLYNSKSGYNDFFCMDRMMRSITPAVAEVRSARAERSVFGPTAWLFEGDADHVRGQASTPLSWSRNLIVTDEDLVPDQDDAHGEVSLSLRGRDLRYAVLDRSDLHRADLTGADLRWSSLQGVLLEETTAGCVDAFGDGTHKYREKACLLLNGANLRWARLNGAYLVGANLQGANVVSADLQNADMRWSRMSRADFNGTQFQNAKLNQSELQGTDFRGANLEGAQLASATIHEADFSATQLQQADLNGAKLQGADLSSAELQGANLRDAKLRRANLQDANLQGANLREAELQGANLRRAKLQGASLAVAELQGATLTVVMLQGADLSSAKLHGADLSWANLTGAYLFLAELQGADLRYAIMSGADLRRAELQAAKLGSAPFWGADLRKAVVWYNNPFHPKFIYHTDFKDLVPREPRANELAALRRTLKGLADADVRARMKERLKPLLDDDERKAWTDSPDHRTWKKSADHPRPDPAELTDYLAYLACVDDLTGYVAKGVAGRAMRASEDKGTRLDAPRLAKALLEDSCEGKRYLSEDTTAELQKLVKKAPPGKRKDPPPLPR